MAPSGRPWHLQGGRLHWRLCGTFREAVAPSGRPWRLQGGRLHWRLCGTFREAMSPSGRPWHLQGRPSPFLRAPISDRLSVLGLKVGVSYTPYV